MLIGSRVWMAHCATYRLTQIHPLLLITFCCLIAGCGRSESKKIQGYVEGEFVYVASPLAGKLVSLNVQRGGQVKTGDLLFALENTAEQALRDEAERRVEQARNKLEDAKKGKRPSEIESLEAQLAQARSALTFSEAEFLRYERLAKSKAATEEDLEQKRNQRDQDRQNIIHLEAEIKTAKLGSRDDFIAAAEAEVKALTAALAKAEWDLSQKQQAAPQAGLIFDTLYRQGEWVAAGRPVISLLPPANIKVRAFVPEPLIGGIQHGDSVQVRVDGVAEPFTGRVSYISPKAEYTPPVIYSQESRSKLVFLIEIVFDPEAAAKLHPGQPVDVSSGSSKS